MGNINSILLTGATGFVGSHILRKLVKLNFKVSIVIRHSSSLWRIEDLKNDVSVYYTDEVSDLFQKNRIGAIIHTATEYGKNASYHDIIKSNVLFPLDLLETGLKHGLKAFVNTDTFFSKTDDYLYLNRYSKSKKIFKDILKNFTGETRIINMQLEHVFGENDAEDKFIPYIINRLLSNDERIDLTVGTQERDFIYVADVVDAYISIINNISIFDDFEDFEIGTSQSLSLRGLVEKIHHLTKSKAILNFGAIPIRSGEIKQSIANNKLFFKTGWKSAIDTQTAIINVIEAYQQKKDAVKNL
ncbi:NAD-dependent epimerase/dehydratase family protein [uncultured Mucilaginibacter sp.]|uniref:NAD-dependent epimerase/dehydratase family protein n=1 Tax=uncultured Mucilaginibacter sp. TaxID=797541 RepID=UPI0025FCCBBD|nr:NAD-dependent epimerase/dehydratase family protein [uncultured Mucilaginibacter sp.]